MFEALKLTADFTLRRPDPEEQERAEEAVRSAKREARETALCALARVDGRIVAGC